jgi:hypothetical protein
MSERMPRLRGFLHGGALVALLGAGCGGDKPAADASPSIEPKLSVIQSQVFGPTCALSASCHKGGAMEGPPKENLDLGGSVWSRIVNKPSNKLPGRMLIVPGNPEASYLYEKIASNAPASGVRMPYQNPPLDPGIIAAVREWIRAGATDQ